MTAHNINSHTELSDKLSISSSLLSSIINGKKQPNLEVVVNLHKTFGMDANILKLALSLLVIKQVRLRQ